VIVEETQNDYCQHFWLVAKIILKEIWKLFGLNVISESHTMGLLEMKLRKNRFPY